MPETPTKPCVVCGRTITWRKKWERDWDSVRYCSSACRKRGVKPVDRELEQAIVMLLDQRQAGATICPSEAARHVAGDDEAQWRPLMEPARMAARRLVHQGRVVITQKGKPADPDHARGPIRVRKA